MFNQPNNLSDTQPLPNTLSPTQSIPTNFSNNQATSSNFPSPDTVTTKFLELEYVPVVNPLQFQVDMEFNVLPASIVKKEHPSLEGSAGDIKTEELDDIIEVSNKNNENGEQEGGKPIFRLGLEISSYDQLIQIIREYVKYHKTRIYKKEQYLFQQ